MPNNFNAKPDLDQIDQFSGTSDNSDLVLSDQVLTIDPRVILHEQLRAILAFTEEDLASTRMDLCILGDIGDFTLENGPAVIFLVMLFHFFRGVVHCVWVLYQVLTGAVLGDEFLNKRGIQRVS